MKRSAFRHFIVLIAFFLFMPWGVFAETFSLISETTGETIDFSSMAGLYAQGVISPPDIFEKPRGAAIFNPRTEKKPNLTVGDTECQISKASNPTARNDQIAAMAYDDQNAMYSVGFQRMFFPLADSAWRIEKRDFTTGNLVKGFGPFKDGTLVIDPSQGSDIAYAFAVNNLMRYMIVVGADNSPRPFQQGVNDADWQWRIEKRSLDTGDLIPGFGPVKDGIVTSNPSKWDDEPLSITIDGTYLYVAGFDSAKGFNNFQWRIEKRRLDTGELVAGFGQNLDGVETIDLTKYWDVSKDISVDGQFIYLAGSENFDPAANDPEGNWHIEKRDLVTGKRVAGFGPNKDGIAVSDPSRWPESPRALEIDKDYMYAVGYDRVPGTSQWRIEKRKLSDGSFDMGFGKGGVIQYEHGDQEETAEAIVIDQDYMYLAGWDSNSTFSQDFYAEWLIQKRKLSDGSLDPNFGRGGLLFYNPLYFRKGKPWSLNDAARAIIVKGNCIRAGGYETIPDPPDLVIGELQWRILGGKKTNF